jgi:uncharacterized protein
MDEVRPNCDNQANSSPPEINQSSHSILDTHSSANLPGTHNIFIGPEGLRPGWRIFLYVGMGFIVFFLLSSFEHLIPERGAGFLWEAFYIQAVLAISSVVPALAMAKIENRQFCAYGLGLRRIRPRLFCYGLLWGLVAISALMLLMSGFGVFSFGAVALHGARIVKFALFWGVFFFLVGIFEEFTFRGYTQFTVSQAAGFWASAFILSIGFGALHLIGNVGETWLGSLCAALIGLFFCFTLRRTGSLWFAVGMHASWDWGESYLYSVPDSGGMVTGHLLRSSFHGSRWLTGGTVGPEGSVLAFVVIGAAWLLFDRVYRARDGGRASPPVVTTEDGLPRPL